MKKSTYNTRYIIFISFVSALGGYLFGFDFAVISGALPFLRDQFGLNEYWEGFTTGVLALGCIAGCLLAASVSEKYGRKASLMTAAAIFAISSLAMAFSANLTIFILFRFVAGIGVGMASMMSPMYIAEVSPATIRGRMVAINQLTIVLGILITNLINYSLRNEGTDAWRWMFGLGVVPSVIFFVGVIFLPESPRWLLKNGQEAKATKILAAIGDADFVQISVQSFSQSLTQEKKISYRAAFLPQFLPAILVGIGLAVFQQFCGINVVFNYTSNIFESIGASKDDQLLQTVFIGGVNVVFTIIAFLLVDKIGRKPLMLLGAAGLTILYITIAYLLSIKSPATSIYLLAAIGLYATTLAPVTWVLISEIFPTEVRSAATSIAVICLWAAYFILVFSFPILEKIMGGTKNTFYLYAAICAAGFVFIKMKVKETKGKTLEEMEGIFGGH